MSNGSERDLDRGLGKTPLIAATIDVGNETGWRTLHYIFPPRAQALLRRRTQAFVRVVILCTIVICLTTSLWLYTNRTGSTSSSSYTSDVFNASLGFQKVYVLGLPSRTDRRDAITLAARFTGFDFEWIDGVRPDDIADEAIPTSWDFARENKAVLATWRAHVNLLQKIIHDNTATALILEDDSDWDITLKAQLAQFATGVRLISSPPSTSIPHIGPTSSPYGPDWHLLWPGTCRMSPSDNTTRFYIQPDDLTVPPPARRWAVWSSHHRPPEAQQPHTRMTFRADGTGMCMYAYAVTQLGAQKALAQLALRPQRKPVDVLLRNLCRGADVRVVGAFDCYGVYPPLVGSHRAEGSGTRDSNNRETKAEKHGEYTRDVVYSTTINAGRIVAGGGAAEVLAQWPEDVERVAIRMDEDFTALVGTGSVRDIDLALLGETDIPPLEE